LLLPVDSCVCWFSVYGCLFCRSSAVHLLLSYVCILLSIIVGRSSVSICTLSVFDCRWSSVCCRQ
jgi:hypothetical protein